MTAASKKCECKKGTSYVCSKGCSNYGTDGKSCKKNSDCKIKKKGRSDYENEYYYQKYMKYKSKYQILKNKLGGAAFTEMNYNFIIRNIKTKDSRILDSDKKTVQYIYFKNGYDKLTDLRITDATRDAIFQSGKEQFKKFQAYSKNKMVQSFYKKEKDKDKELTKIKSSAPGYNKMKRHFNDFIKHFKLKTIPGQVPLLEVDSQIFGDFINLSTRDLNKILDKFDEKKYFGIENKKFLKLDTRGLRNLNNNLAKLKSELSDTSSDKFKEAYKKFSEKIPGNPGEIKFSKKRKVMYNGVEYEILKLDEKINDDIKKIKQEKKDAKKEGDDKLEKFKADLESDAAFVSNLDLSSLKVIEAGTRTSGTSGSTGSVNTSAFTSGAVSGTSKLESYVKLLKKIKQAPLLALEARFIIMDLPSVASTLGVDDTLNFTNLFNTHKKNIKEIVKGLVDENMINNSSDLDRLVSENIISAADKNEILGTSSSGASSTGTSGASTSGASTSGASTSGASTSGCPPCPTCPPVTAGTGTGAGAGTAGAGAGAGTAGACAGTTALLANLANLAKLQNTINGMSYDMENLTKKMNKHKKNSRMYLKLSLELAKHIEKSKKYGFRLN